MTTDGYFDPASVFWQVTREQILVVGGGAALLMQIAHPAVAQGVAEHSDFRTRPIKRLVGTLRTIRAIVFGDRARADAALAALRRVHANVRGQVQGKPYRASDPELLAWVHATLMYASVRTYDSLVAALDSAARQAFHEDARRLGALLGVPAEHQPADWASFESALLHKAASLEVGDTARGIAGSVLDPPIVVFPAVARDLLTTATTALIPAALRPGFRLRFGDRERARWESWRHRLRVARSLAPPPMRYPVAAWRGHRAVQRRQASKHAARPS